MAVPKAAGERTCGLADPVPNPCSGHLSSETCSHLLRVCTRSRGMTIASTSTPSCALCDSCGFYAAVRQILEVTDGARRLHHVQCTEGSCSSMALSSSHAGRTARERGSSSVYVSRKAKCRRRQGCYLKCLVDAGSVCSHPHSARVRI